MSGWLLILTLSFPGAADQSAPVGIIFDADLCQSIGNGLSVGLEMQTPGLRARWACHAVGGDEA